MCALVTILEYTSDNSEEYTSDNSEQQYCEILSD
jgi:hypothetical protein